MVFYFLQEKVVIKMGLQGDKAWGKIMETAARCEGTCIVNCIDAYTNEPLGRA
jgi:hypothetical protein